MFFKKNKLWSTGLFVVKKFDIKDLNKLCVEKVLFSPKKIRKRKNNTHTYADPFLFVHNDDIFLFLEEKKSYEKGKIIAFKSKDTIDWHYLGVVLEEPHHLSYPFVFKLQDNIYMLPEAGESCEISLYKSNTFPTSWKKIKTIVKGEQYSDSSIFFHNKMFWLFTNIGYDKLYIFYSTDLMGDWKAHSKNPVVKNKLLGRNGGGPFIYMNKIYRSTQNCSKGYGQGVTITEIKKLTKNDFEEEVTTSMNKGIRSWNNLNIHHFNIKKFKGKKIIAIDGKGYDYSINKIIGLFFRLKNKLCG